MSGPNELDDAMAKPWEGPAGDAAKQAATVREAAERAMAPDYESARSTEPTVRQRLGLDP